MTAYVFTLGMVFTLIALGKRKNSLTHETFFLTYKSAFLALLPLTFIAVCRWNVGIDSVYRGTYWTAYQASIQGENIFGFEPLFFLLMKVCATANISFWGFLAIHSLLFMSGVTYAIKRGSISVNTSVLLFFSLFIYFDSYSSLRQSLSEALGMILISIMLTTEEGRKKDIVAIVLLAFACGFHTVSLLYVPIYFICKIRFSKKEMLYVAIASMAAYPLLQKIFTTIMRFFFASKYEFIGVARINLLMSLTIFVVCFMFYNDICDASEYGYKVISIALIVFVIMLNSGALLLPYRCFDCLKVVYVFVVPAIIKSIKNWRCRFVVCLILILIFGYWFINAFFLQDPVYAHYASIFEDMSVIYMK